MLQRRERDACSELRCPLLRLNEGNGLLSEWEDDASMLDNRSRPRGRRTKPAFLFRQRRRTDASTKPELLAISSTRCGTADAGAVKCIHPHLAVR